MDEYPGWFTYTIDKSSSLYPEETIHSDNYEDFNLVRSDSLDPLKKRAGKQALLLRKIIPSSSVTVKCASFVVVQDKVAGPDCLDLKLHYTAVPRVIHDQAGDSLHQKLDYFKTLILSRP